jgi:hypothetical protein
LPHTEVGDDFGLPECPRWKVIDRNDLSTLVDKLRRHPTGRAGGGLLRSTPETSRWLSPQIRRVSELIEAVHLPRPINA